MDYKEKYEQGLECIQEILSSGQEKIKMTLLKERLQPFFPELGESEDELTWLTKFIEEEAYSLSMDIRDNEDRIKLKNLQRSLAWLEKQGEKKQFYIRFGDIPEGEKSSVWRGDKFLRKENGVSVYPAFKHNGNIVLGLSLPITKTTLYTLQHLLEYDNRPCYLVIGDYIGNGADGEPLIRNVEIVEEIKDFRVKEGEARYKIKDSDSLSVNGQPFDHEKAIITQKDFEEIVNAVKDTSILDMIEDKDAFTNPGVFENSLGRLLKLFEKLPKQDLLDGLKFYANVVKHDGEYVKPTEWSEDDERIVTALMEGFRYHQLFNPRFGEVPNAEIIDWIKSLKGRLS